jgi:hypothetical protein
MTTVIRQYTPMAPTSPSQRLSLDVAKVMQTLSEGVDVEIGRCSGT